MKEKFEAVLLQLKSNLKSDSVIDALITDNDKELHSKLINTIDKYYENIGLFDKQKDSLQNLLFNNANNILENTNSSSFHLYLPNYRNYANFLVDNYYKNKNELTKVNNIDISKIEESVEKIKNTNLDELSKNVEKIKDTDLNILQQNLNLIKNIDLNKLYNQLSGDSVTNKNFTESLDKVRKLDLNKFQESLDAVKKLDLDKFEKDVKKIQNNLTSINEIEFEQRYMKLISLLNFYNEAESNLILYTKKEHKLFKLYKNSNNSIVIKAGKETADMSLPLNKCISIIYKNEEPRFKSYTEVLFPKILDSSIFDEIKNDNFIIGDGSLIGEEIVIGNDTEDNKETVTNNFNINLNSDYFIKKKDEIKPSLGVEGIAEVISNILNKGFNDSGMMFGIFGKWGRGKTYLFNKIKAKLKNNYITVEFSAWKYQETKESWAYLYENLLENYLDEKENIIIKQNILQKLLGIKAFKIFNLNIEKYGLKNIVIFLCLFIGYLIFSFCIDKTELVKFIASTIGIVVVLKLFMAYLKFKDSALNMYTKYFSKKSFNDVLGFQAEVQKEIKNLLKCWTKDSDKKIVLFVDDLDRCDSSQILKVLDGLRIILDEKEIYEKLIIITAIDENIIKDAISKKYSSDKEMNIDYYQDYIEKIFLTGVRLNTLNDNESKEFLETLFKINNNDLDTKESDSTSLNDLNTKENDSTSLNDLNTKENDSTSLNDLNTKENDSTSLNDFDFDKKERTYLLENINKLKKPTPRRIRIFYFKYLLYKNLLQLRLREINKYNLWLELDNHNVIIDILLDEDLADINDELKKELIYVKEMVSIL